MPDPTVSDALAEAYAIAPVDEMILNTIEIQHPLFVDDAGDPDSVRMVDQRIAVDARLEATASIHPGEVVTFQAGAFSFSLAPIEPGSVPELEITIDNVRPALVAQLDRAVTDVNNIRLIFRPYLESELDIGPAMDPPPAFLLASVSVSVLTLTAKARTVIDLRNAFPRRLYSATDFPGLIGL